MSITFSSKPRFDDDVSIALLLDTDRGYRHTSERQWRIVPLKDMLTSKPRWWESASLDLMTALEDLALVPKVELEAASNAKIRVSAPVRLVVQAHDERLPHVVDGPVDVSYGTVVRAGPLLFSVLFAEQVESLSTGRISLPFVGGTVDLSRDDALELFSRPFERRSRALKLWSGLFCASFLLTGATAVAGALSRNATFCYGSSPMDTIAACVGCVLLTWVAQLAVGLPIHRRVLRWVYSSPEM